MTKFVSALLFALALVMLIISMIGAMYIIIDYNREDICYEVGTDVVGWRFTRPDNYELLYRTTFENGLSVDRWISVTREVYFTEMRKKR